MSLYRHIENVRMARERVARHRAELAVPASAWLARGQRHPLTTMGAAAGAGFALGSFGVSPMRVPGLVSLLGGGVAQIVAQGIRLIAELSMDEGRDDGDDHGES